MTVAASPNNDPIAIAQGAPTDMITAAVARAWNRNPAAGGPDAIKANISLAGAIVALADEREIPIGVLAAAITFVLEAALASLRTDADVESSLAILRDRVAHLRAQRAHATQPSEHATSGVVH